VRRGDVYWFDLGAPQGSVQGKLRPVLVIQNDSGNASSPTTIIAAITSQQKNPYPFHVEFTAEESGLSKDGTVLLEQLHTVNINELGSLLGRLPDARMANVDQALRFSLRL
jgi:mRNA interferase MazF